MKESDYLDADDIRMRGTVNLHPTFYWRCIYNDQTDQYDIRPFMRINNGDGSRADWMDVAVTQKHTMRYADVWRKFRNAQDPKRTTFTREEMLHVQPFRDRYEYHKSICLLPPTDPDYQMLVSDFSVRLNPEDITVLNRICTGEEQLEVPQVDAPDTRSQGQKILEILGKVADTLDSLDARITQLETNK